jgi:hypothetical protein
MNMGPPSSKQRRWEWIGLAAILSAALAIRLYALDRIPAVVFHDECDNLVNVYQILNGKGPGFFGLDWKPQPAASVYLLSLSMRVGMSIWTLRLPAVLFSVAALIPFHLLARRTLGVPAALLTTGLLATDIWYLHFSRSGWENIETCLFLMTAALCICDGVRSGRLRSFAGAGACAALGAYGYFGGRAVLPTVLLIGLLSLLRPSIPRRRLVGGILLMLAVALLLFAPQLRTVVSKWDTFQRRSRDVYILAGSKTMPVVEQLSILARSFVSKGQQLFSEHIPIGIERGNRYLPMSTGAFTRPTAALLGAGMIISVFWLSETWLWWLLLLLPFVLTEVLTRGSLNGARGVIFVPVLYLFVGLSIHLAWRLCRRVWRPLAALVVVGVIALCLSTTRRYFEWAQSPELLFALEPAIPVAEFPEWQAFQLEKAKTGELFNVLMWKNRERQRTAQQFANPLSRDEARELLQHADQFAAVSPSGTRKLEEVTEIRQDEESLARATFTWRAILDPSLPAGLRSNGPDLEGQQTGEASFQHDDTGWHLDDIDWYAR